MFACRDAPHLSLPVSIDKSREEIWLNRNHIAELYGRDVKTIGKHIANALSEELSPIKDSTVAKCATVQSRENRKVTRQPTYQTEKFLL